MLKSDEQRLVGLVMIPGKHMLNIDIEDLDASNEYMWSIFYIVMPKG